MENTNEFSKIKELAKKFPNDQEFGAQVRKFLNECEELEIKKALFNSDIMLDVNWVNWVKENILGIKPDNNSNTGKN